LVSFFFFSSLVVDFDFGAVYFSSMAYFDFGATVLDLLALSLSPSCLIGAAFYFFVACFFFF
jgi:hypothetical protein